MTKALALIRLVQAARNFVRIPGEHSFSKLIHAIAHAQRVKLW